MPRTRRSELTAEARRVNTEQMARAGWDLRTSRRRRKLTQRRLTDGAMLGSWAPRAGVAGSRAKRMKRLTLMDSGLLRGTWTPLGA